MSAQTLTYWWVALVGTLVIGVLLVGFLATLIAANRRLREERDFSETILEGAPAAILVLDTLGRMVRANQRAAEILWNGGNPSEKDPPISDLFDKHLKPNWEKLLNSDGRPLEFEMVHVGPGETTAHIAWSFRVIRNERQPRWVVGIGTDLTEKKRVERLMFEAQKMEAIARLAGGIAHDFNNMLTAIMGYCYQLGKQLRRNPKAKAAVHEIDATAERAANLTRQLLALSREQIFEPHPVSLNAVVSDLENIIRRLASESVDVTVDLAEDVGIVLADPTQIERVLVNLVLNARDAMPMGGSLRIATFVYDHEEGKGKLPASARPGSYAVITVEDTGTGIDADTMQHIFEPFFTTKPAGQGTGLGLAVVYGIVQQLNGHIFVHSSPGQGTRFEIYLPQMAPPEPRSEPEAVRPRQRLQGTVLLVEDDDRVRELAAHALRETGLEVRTATDGLEAIRQSHLLKHRIDLLITDVVMPRMSGREVAARLHLWNPSIRVLYISGYPEEAIRNYGVLEEGALLLQKPFSPEELVDLVAQLLPVRSSG